MKYGLPLLIVASWASADRSPPLLVARISVSLRGRGFSANGDPMALAIADNRISQEDYLQAELASEIRHEYVAGNPLVGLQDAAGGS